MFPAEGRVGMVCLWIRDSQIATNWELTSLLMLSGLFTYFYGIVNLLVVQLAITDQLLNKIL